MSYQLTAYGKTYEVVVKKSHYQNNGSLAIVLEETDGCPFATLTVNLPHFSDNLPEDCAFLDTNNCDWAESFLRDSGLGQPVSPASGLPSLAPSGYCLYPLYQFKINLMREAR